MAPVTIVYFCYGWTLWLYLTWLPKYFLHEYKFDLSKSALFHVSGLLRRRRRRLPRRRGQRPHPPSHRRCLQKARRNVVMFGFSRIVRVPRAGLPDARPRGDHRGARRRVLLRGVRHRTDVVDSDGHRAASSPAPAAGMMNTGSALAAILSPIAFGYIIDATGNWQLPFAGLARLPAARRPARADDAP